MSITPVQRHYWIFSADPHHYHWDTLFVKGKEMWHGAGAKPDAIRALKQVRKGDRVLCYHSAPERSLYSIAEVTRDPYPDPHDRTGKNLVADLRAFEKLPRQVTLAELRANPAHGRDRRDAGNPAALRPRARTAAVPQVNPERCAGRQAQSELR